MCCNVPFLDLELDLDQMARRLFSSIALPKVQKYRISLLTVLHRIVLKSGLKNYDDDAQGRHRKGNYCILSCSDRDAGKIRSGCGRLVSCGWIEGQGRDSNRGCQ